VYTVTRLVDLNLLSEPDQSTQYGGVISEFVFDNSRINGMNMIEGTRFKVRYENQLGITDGNQSFNRISLDLRRYQKIHRDLILATRFAMSHSAGRAPKQSIMGGMENWILNRKEGRTANNPLAFGPGIDNRDVFFSEFATNLRGFNLNRLSGTSYVLVNAELRIPLIKYIYRGPITSNFLRNFQVVGFSDVGTAWTGKGPFSQENSLNTEIIGGRSDPFRATVTNFRNPYLMGYGVGARTMLFGFYVKFDYAWGMDNGVTNKAIPYLTLGYDF
jgi:outer membrane protein assembly factor BamA